MNFSWINIRELRVKRIKFQSEIFSQMLITFCMNDAREAYWWLHSNWHIFVYAAKQAENEFLAVEACLFLTAFVASQQTSVFCLPFPNNIK